MTVMIPEAAGAVEGAAARGGSTLRSAASRKASSSAPADRGAGSPAAKRAASRVAPPPRSSQGESGGAGGGGGGTKGKGSAPSKTKPKMRATPKKPTPPKPPAKGKGKGKSKGKSGFSRVVPKDASKLVLAEFVACLVILILSPLSSKGSKDLDKGGAIDMMLKASALSFVFFVLALISSAGGAASKVSAGFGGVITLGYLVAQGDVFANLANLFTTPQEKAAAGAAAGAGSG